MKKYSFLLGILAFVLLVSLAFPKAEAAEILYSGNCGNSLTWTLDSEGTLTISGTGAMKNYTSYAPWYSYRASIKTVIIESGVTSIGERAFYECSSLTSVTIGNGVTSIGWHAFSYCSSLTAITIPDSVTSIGYSAFSRCSSLTAITIPDSVTSIGDEAFYECSSLTAITIPDSVTSIGDDAFYNCSSLTAITIPDSVTSIGDDAFELCSSLTAITIPDSVTSIGDDAFHNCDSLTGIWVDAENPNYSSDSYGVLFNKDKSTLIAAPGAISGSYTIPDSVTSIGDSAFSSCYSLTAITIPAGVTSIGAYAFRYCSSLTNVTIGNGVTSIGDSAFRGCSSLTAITIPDSVTSIGDDAFSYCDSLTAITIPDSVTSIGAYAFRYCSSLTNVTIGNGVTSIGDSAFRGCSSLTAITIPDSVTSIGDYAFDSCSSLKHVLYTGTADQWGSISKGDSNYYLTYATRHYEASGEEVYWTKNCVNSGYYCEICNAFITMENAESGTHTYADNMDSECDDCGHIRKIRSISVYSYPSVREYPWHEGELDVTGGVLQATYNDGVSFKLDMTPDMVTGFDNTVLGTQTLTVTYAEKTTSYTVKIVPGTPDSLQLATLPDTLSYTTGGKLSLSGLTLTAYYSGLDPVTVPASEVTADAVDMSAPGIKTVTVRWKNASAAFEIYVHEKQSQTVDASLYPESSHNYASSTDETKTFTYPGAGSLVLTFNSSSYTESSYDFVYLFDGEGNQIGKYSGSLAGKVVTIPGNTFRIRLTSDGSVNKYGYAFSSIVAETILHPELAVPGTAATCTAPGKTAGSVCSICSMVLQQQEDTPALGHSFVNGTCSACGASDPDYVEPVEQFELSGANLVLGNDLTMNFALLSSNLNGTDYYAEIVKYNPDGSTTTTTYPFSNWTAYGPMYLITLDGLVAKQMSDKVEVTIYTTDGVQASYTWEDSIRDYAIRQLNTTSNTAKVFTVLADMLNYGAAAQVQFKYNTSDLANATMTDTHKSYATASLDFGLYTNNQVAGTNFYGTILALETNIKMGVFFKGKGYEGYTAKVSYRDHNGNAVSYEVAGADFDATYAANGMYGIMVDTLVAGDVYQVVTVEVYDGETLVASVSESMESYVVRQSASLLPIYDALMKFMVSSYNYSH